MEMIFYGLISGILFGFFLQKAEMVRYEKFLGAMLFRDMTLFKFMFSAIAVGMIGIYFLHEFEIIKLSVKATVLGGNIGGGLIFGAGWAILGYCPGTAGGALGEGRWDSVWGIIGMITGAVIYAETYPALKASVLTWGNFGKITLPSVLGITPWIPIVIITASILLLFRFFKNRNL